jgi:hypothetical protein
MSTGPGAVQGLQYCTIVGLQRHTFKLLQLTVRDTILSGIRSQRITSEAVSPDADG